MLRCLSCKQIWVRILPDQIRENPLTVESYCCQPSAKTLKVKSTLTLTVPLLTQTLFFNNKFLYFLVGARTKLN